MMMYTNIFDTHSHYVDNAFDADRMELLSKMPENGVNRVMLAGCTPEDSGKCLQLAEQFPYVWSAVGIHPCNVSPHYEESDISKIEALTKHQKAVAIGERLQQRNADAIFPCTIGTCQPSGTACDCAYP